MSLKERLSASVDADLLAAAQAAVAQGRCANVSAWVNEALRRHRDHELRLSAMDAFLDQFEREHGVITEDEMRAAERQARRGMLTDVTSGRVKVARPRRRGAA